MNWRTGLFRIWTALSVVWIITCAIYGYDGFKRSTFVVTDQSGMKFVVRAPSNTAQSNVVAFVEDSDTAKTHRENCAKYPDPICQFPLPLSMPNTIEFWPLLVTAMVGPLGSLLAGFLAFWAAAALRTPE